MFYDILYYWAMLSSATCLTYAVASIYYPQETKEILSVVVWNTSNTVYFLKDKTDRGIELVQDCLDKIQKTKTIIDKNGKETTIKVNKIYNVFEIDSTNTAKKLNFTFEEFVSYKINKDYTYYIQLHKSRNDKNRYKLMSYDDFNKINAESMLLEYIEREQIIEKPFIHITLNINNEKKDIHDYLDKFYVDGNELLTYKFLKWYLKHYYKTELTKPYSIDIIDNKIQMIKLQQNHGIYIKNNTYEIYTIEHPDNSSILDTV